MTSLRSVRAVVGVAVLGLVETVYATPLSFGFQVEFTVGPLSGQTASGLLAVDSADCMGGCNGTFTPSDADVELLAFGITVDGYNYSLFHDIQFATGLYPNVSFVDGEVVSFDYMGLQTGLGGERQLNLSYASGAPGSVVFYDTSFVVDASFGSIAVVGQIPEPGSAALISAALIGWAVTTRRAGRWRR